jgi:hypothetical protein
MKPLDRLSAEGYLLKMRRPMGTVLAGLLVGVLAAGCSLLPGTQTESCVDWVHFETPEQQFQEAGLVLIGNPVAKDGETSIYGYTAQVHRVDVEAVLKGEPGPGPLRVASMPLTCTGGVSYPEGDPLDANRRMLMYASRQNGDWFTMTPAQGAVPFEPGTQLPFKRAS